MTRSPDHTLQALAERFGTPLYVFDERELTRRVRNLRGAFPASTGLCFAIKANPFILPALAPLVERLEACSPGEYRICRSLDVPNERIVVSGVHKDRATIEAALSQARLPAAITIESPAQLELVLAVAEEQDVTAPLLLRLTSGNQFGLDRETLMELVPALREHPHADVHGIQYFSGTQKTSPRRIQRELDKLAELLDDLKRLCSWTPRELEYGPGLPVAYFEGDAFDEDALLAAVSAMLSSLPFDGQVTLELGRSIAASCGTYLTRVVDAKVNAGQRYAIVDGGIHHLTYYGQSMAMKQPPCRVLDAPKPDAREPDSPSPGVDSLEPAVRESTAPKPDAPGPTTDAGSGTASAPAPDTTRPPDTWALCGSLCTVNDLLAKQLALGDLTVGDVLAFEKAGAYCMTEGISLFLSRDLPAVATIDGTGRAALVRPHTPTDPLNTPAS